MVLCSYRFGVSPTVEEAHVDGVVGFSILLIRTFEYFYAEIHQIGRRGGEHTEKQTYCSPHYGCASFYRTVERQAQLQLYVPARPIRGDLRVLQAVSTVRKSECVY
jgi:hypothetical protein